MASIPSACHRIVVILGTYLDPLGTNTMIIPSKIWNPSTHLLCVCGQKVPHIQERCFDLTTWHALNPQRKNTRWTWTWVIKQLKGITYLPNRRTYANLDVMRHNNLCTSCKLVGFDPYHTVYRIIKLCVYRVYFKSGLQVNRLYFIPSF